MLAASRMTAVHCLFMSHLQALVELLVHLKRAYWPFPWDTNVDAHDAGGRGSLGGFRWALAAS